MTTEVMDDDFFIYHAKCNLNWIKKILSVLMFFSMLLYCAEKATACYTQADINAVQATTNIAYNAFLYASAAAAAAAAAAIALGVASVGFPLLFPAAVAAAELAANLATAALLAYTAYQAALTELQNEEANRCCGVQ